MTPKTAQSILFKISNPEFYIALEQYIDERINELVSILERATTMDEVARLQGAIKELKALKVIRESAQKVITAERK